MKHASEPTRLQVILILVEGEQHVGALCDQLGQSQPAVSHHLALLRHGGIIAPRRQGKHNFYSLTDIGSDLASVVERLTSDGRSADRRRTSLESPPSIRSTRPAHKHAIHPPAPAPHIPPSEIEEESWSVMNRRRAELIFKKNRGGLDDVERLELERLQAISRARMHREFCSPSLTDQKLGEIEENLRGSGVDGK